VTFNSRQWLFDENIIYSFTLKNTLKYVNINKSDGVKSGCIRQETAATAAGISQRVEATCTRGLHGLGPGPRA
jgi:hypothetical protein